MKFLKFIYATLLLTTLMVFHSCSIQETVKDTPTPAVATSEDDITAVIVGMYSRFNDSGMFKFLGHIMLTVCADDIYSTAGSNYGPYAQRTFSSTDTSPMWNNMYASIANANNLIAQLDKLNLSNAFEKRAYGEAYFIRAFCYYYLVRLYGGVPIRTEATNINSDFYLPRKSVDEVYAQIFSDFKKASERLPEYGTPQYPAADLGRATKGAAQALLAQAYLTYGDMLSLKGQSGTTNFQNAVTYADSVISSGRYRLLSNYADLYDVSKEALAYDEVIFGIRFQTDPTNRAQPAAGSEFAPRFGASNTWYISGNPNSGNGDNTYRVSHWFADYCRMGDYGNGKINANATSWDYRNDASFFITGFNGNNGRTYYVYPNLPPSSIPADTTTYAITDPLLHKYVDPAGKDGRNNGNDFYIIRYSEVYLIKAEALNEISGPTNADAIKAINTVRDRARNANGTARTYPLAVTTTSAGTKDQFRMKIFDERGFELVGEGQRWFDLVRMRSPNSPSQTMYEYQFFYRLNDATTYPQKFPTYNSKTRKFSNRNAVYPSILNVSVPKFLLFPVPNSELIQNKNFGPQNPGW